MPLTDIFRRASTYILGYEEDIKNFLKYENNEVLFCKNNVCVHPPAMVRHDNDILHNPGYLTVTTKIFIDQFNDVRRPTLFLTWIPNRDLSKCSMNLHKRQMSMESLGSNDSFNSNTNDSAQSRPVSIELKSTNPFLNFEDKTDTSESVSSEDSDKINSVININVDISNPDIEIIQTPDSVKDPMEQFEFSRSASVTSTDSQYNWISTPEYLMQKHNLSFPESVNSSPILPAKKTHKCRRFSVDLSQMRSLSVKDPMEQFEFSRSASVTSTDSQYNWISTPEYLMQKHNLSFPESVNSSPILPAKKTHKCRRFSVDLSQMRSLRLFFSDNSCTCGQLVVASRESQYKILHFHHGGLDHLAQVLHQWHSLLHNIKSTKGGDENLPYRHFMVCRPEVSELELHPEEGQVSKLTEEIFRSLFTETGQLEDDLALRKHVFFSGMDRDIRKEVWPFLLHVYPYQSTFEERLQIADIRRQEYEEITRRRLDLNENKLKQFRRKIQSVVEKDVVRTDRGNPFFAGDDNPNLVIMKNILLNYAIYNPGLGYTQGMSDLLSPVLCELKDEVAAFWCFVGLMQRAVFVATPTDRDMDRSLRYLRELVKLMVPKFYTHLEKHKDAMELLFCHRWILLCFKREFTEAVALRMWESCWANYLTDYFHLFLCLAIISVYADDVIAQDLRADEMLLHFSSLAMYMDGLLITRKARGLLHQFRQLREIPCSLNGLCTRCGPGIWDSSHSPRIFCSCNGPCGNTFINGS